VVLLILGYPLSLILRHALHPGHTSLFIRHLYSLSMGLVMGFLCFGWQQMALLIFIVLISYLFLHLIPPNYTHR
jgi:hypothetical protein